MSFRGVHFCLSSVFEAVRDIEQRPLPVHGHLLKERVMSVLQTVRVTTALKKKVRGIVFFENLSTLLCFV